MIRPLLPLAVLALCACAADLAGRDASVAELETSTRVFISPSGEPFRRTDPATTPLGAWFGGADLDRSGALDRPEFRADAERFFRVVDASGDGVIDDAEIQTYERRIAPEIAPDFELRSRPDPTAAVTDDDGVIRLPVQEPGPGRRGRSGEAPTVLRILPQSQAVAAADYDQSRSVTREEFLRATEDRFARLDGTGATPGDGRLSLTELRAIRVPPERRGRARRGPPEDR